MPTLSDMALLKTGAMLEGLHGKAGNAVYVRTASGVSVRDYVIPRDPKSPLQRAARQRIARCAEAWHQLTPQQGQRWREYALRLGKREPGSQTVVAPRAQNVFNALACRLQQLDPNAVIPLEPPASIYFGESVAINVTASAGEITFEASAPNTANVVTDLLIQRLTGGASTPQLKEYRHQTFVSFSSGHLSETLSVEPGWYACAFRFVNTETGQDTGLTIAGIVKA